MKRAILLCIGLVVLAGCNSKKEEENYVKTKDSLDFFKQAYKAANYFSIEDNENARAQFAEVNVDDAMQKVQFDLKHLEKTEGGNPLLPISLEGEKTYMNKAAVLNHKWIIMDYYKKDEEGAMVEVGELLIEYTFHSDKPCDFFVLSRIVY